MTSHRRVVQFLVLVLATGCYTQVASAEDPIRDALLQLERAPTKAAQLEALAVLEQVPPDTAPVIEGLLQCWQTIETNDADVRLRALELIAAKTGDATVQLVLRDIKAVAAHEKPSGSALIREFFGRSALAICDRISGKASILKIAATVGDLWTIASAKVPSDVKRHYLLEALPNTGNFIEARIDSLACYFDSAALSELSRFVELTDDPKARSGLMIAMRTLAQIGDESVIPLLDRMRTNDYFDTAERDELDVFVAKLRFGGSPQDLLNLLRAEARNIRMIQWLVLRLLYLEADPAIVEEYLRQGGDERLAGIRGAMAQELFYPAEGIAPLWHSCNTLALDRKDLLGLCPEAHASAASRIVAMDKYSARSLLARAHDARRAGEATSQPR